MNPIHGNKDPMLVAKDAIFFSPHKFIGGVDTPGILVAKKQLFRNKTPFTAGGGTVFYVSINCCSSTVEPVYKYHSRDCKCVP